MSRCELCGHPKTMLLQDRDGKVEAEACMNEACLSENVTPNFTRVRSSSNEDEKKLVTNTIRERESTHGDFKGTAYTAQRLKNELRSKNIEWDHIHYDQLEALDMICTKIARILHGDHCEPDHWHDIAGYATLVEKSLK